MRAGVLHTMRISGSTSFVTGANRGIGLAITRELAQRGATVLAGVREAGSMPALGEGVSEVVIDLGDRKSIETAAARAVSADILVNNAGQLQAGRLEDEDVADI